MESSEPSWGLPSEISPYCFIRIMLCIEKNKYSILPSFYKSLYQETFI